MPEKKQEKKKASCGDKDCPVHGKLRTRGRTFTGTVVSSKMQKSATVQWTGKRFIPKYERYKKVRTKITVHNPPCINAAEGDTVKIIECRPLSKTKKFAIVEKVKDESS